MIWINAYIVRINLIIVNLIIIYWWVSVSFVIESVNKKKKKISCKNLGKIFKGLSLWNRIPDANWRNSHASDDSRGNSDPVTCRNLLCSVGTFFPFMPQVWITRKERVNAHWLPGNSLSPDLSECFSSPAFDRFISSSDTNVLSTLPDRELRVTVIKNEVNNWPNQIFPIAKKFWI